MNIQRRGGGTLPRTNSTRRDGSSESPRGRGLQAFAAGRARRLCILTTALVFVVGLSVYSIRLGRLHPHPDVSRATPEDLELVQRQKQAAAAAASAEGKVALVDGGAVAEPGGRAGRGEVRPFTYFKKGQSGGAKPARPEERGVAPGIPSVPRDYDDVHVIFSTDCSDYQNWQSLLFFYSAERAGQRGRVTRLASGCSEAEIAELKDIHSSMPAKHSVHFTPDFSLDPRTGERYPYYNKPHALRHWLANADPPITETVVALLDPDMVLLRPLRPFVDDDVTLFGRGGGPGEPPVRGTEPWVREGHPIGQLYGLGGFWATWKDLASITGDPHSPALSVSPEEAARHYPVGPPYVAHVRDLRSIADKWVDFVARTYEGHPGILSEMYAFCIAAAHLRLPHRVVQNYMVTDSHVTSGEGWGLIEIMEDKDVCQALPPPLPSLPPTAPLPPLPVTIHYCHLFRAGIYMFGKRRKGLHGIFACPGYYLLEPPPYAGTMRLKVHPPDRIEPVQREEAVRGTFALCALTKMLNEALRDFRRARCTPDQFSEGLADVRQLTDLLPHILADTARWQAEAAL